APDSRLAVASLILPVPPQLLLPRVCADRWAPPLPAHICTCPQQTRPERDGGSTGKEAGGAAARFD
ncbi:hypothetical protein MTO96_007769, partial [Rhipicephalus appendiculatus]